MNIKAADVKKLRDMTGAGMLDCKKALVEAEGDFKQAVKKLKELGLAAAAKRSGRATNNGRVFTRVTDTRAAILELVCETDFVARNKDFIALGDALLDAVFEENISEPNDRLNAMVNDLISTIKENMALKSLTVIDIAENELVADYVHGEGAIGVLVKLRADDPAALSNEAVTTFLFDCALHIAAFNPAYLSRELVDDEYIAEQQEIFAKQVAALGKPANVVENIVKGKLNKHFSEICFLQQPFVKDDKNSVEKVMQDIAKQAGTKLAIVIYNYTKVGADSEE